MKKARKAEQGFTLIEMVVVLAIVALLASILTPMLLRHVEDARIARAQSETRTIGAAIASFERDMRAYPLFSVGTALASGTMDIVTLESPGDMPVEDVASKWTTGTGVDRGKLVGHLITNTPTYQTAPTQDRPFGWKGPYMENLGPDPWGNRYLVNAENLKGTSTKATFVLSAGPNEKVETAFASEEKGTIEASGDDIIARIK